MRLTAVLSLFEQLDLYRQSQEQTDKTMKAKISVITGLAALCLLGVTSPSFAAEKDKEVTVTGEGKCAKCSLKEADKCQNVIEAKEDGKTVKYYLAKNEVSNDFHDNICKESKKVTATGTVKEEDGKKVLTASKIELAK
jgi:hypothetical protein